MFPGGMHGFPSRVHDKGTKSSGIEFLMFHRNLMNEFISWNNIHHEASAVSLTAWNSVPTILKSSADWDSDFQDSENRIISNSPAFNDADELGIEIETKIHNWIHGAVGRSTFPMDAGESNIISNLHSVQSTYFYQIHGMVQFWWDRFNNMSGIIAGTVAPLMQIA
jgi:hypothetical protein